MATHQTYEFRKDVKHFSQGDSPGDSTQGCPVNKTSVRAGASLTKPLTGLKSASSESPMYLKIKGAASTTPLFLLTSGDAIN